MLHNGANMNIQFTSMDTSNKRRRNNNSKVISLDAHKTLFVDVLLLITFPNPELNILSIPVFINNMLYSVCLLYKSRSFVIDRFLVKLFRTSDINIVKLCQSLFSFDLPRMSSRNVIKGLKMALLTLLLRVCEEFSKAIV